MLCFVYFVSAMHFLAFAGRPLKLNGHIMSLHALELFGLTHLVFGDGDDVSHICHIIVASFSIIFILTMRLMSRAHSFPWVAEFAICHGILSVPRNFAEFEK